MSDEEEVVSGSEEEEAPAAQSGPSEAEIAMLKRRAQQQYGDLDEAAQELLAQNKVEQEAMQREISDMKARRERRIKERAEEEQRMAQKRSEEEAKRRAEEDERKRKKEEEENQRREERAKKMAELDKLRNTTGQRNFQITKRETSEVAGDEGEASGVPKKSKEEQEAERKAILSQRIQPLEISGFDAGKLADKAKELHSQILRLEGDKYDLEKRFKAQQRDMMELADKARQINKVGKEGTIKRVSMKEDDVDKIQERFAGAPSKIVMYSEYERQKDKRSYGDRKNLFTGPVYGFPAERIKPYRLVKWDENSGQPVYLPMEGAEIPADAEEEE